MNEKSELKSEVRRSHTDEQIDNIITPAMQKTTKRYPNHAK